MTIETIIIGAAPNDGTGDDPRTAGQKLNSNFTTSTHAASRDVGTASGNIPDADDLNMVGNTNYTSGNLNPNIFRGATNDTIASGFAYSATSTAWSLPILGVSQPISITVSGTFSVRNRVTGAVIAAGIVPTLSAASSYKTLVLDVSGLTVVADTDYSLTADSAASSIEVNF